ncbi:MAG: hypothetical protein DWQ47_10040 [Acidobacteria bacterium]|nr:MAG: hypothetical protein DWQ32_12455 [Acidobacteriota bacterium]REJ98670.1 MAG: hypothetical protein DWQ38_15025 [Acidobacteriota bacterium]REK16674.1 MAG: hypothetical protein DWQ43_00300 [Acidobacteriota bacterium]REK42585.1 MAG: hypothetical protein DWQ47_10040 [Acidobacteriota bacterium]
MNQRLSVTIGAILFAFAPFLILYAAGNGFFVSGGIDDPGIEVIRNTGPNTLEAFRNDRELKQYLRDLAKKLKKRRDRANGGANANSASADVAASPASEASKSDDSVTNVQHAGVDEGGIVKMHGDHLVILRRGRLFTVRVGDDSLKPVSAVDAFGPGLDPGGAWYDEMLISKDTVFVIGYSYQRGGTEVGLFRIRTNGDLQYLSTYHLRSNDYYSSRNYASRLVDGKLVFYMPQYLSSYDLDSDPQLPAYRRWRNGAGEDDFVTLADPRRVYKPAGDLVDDWGIAIHTVTTCGVRGDRLDCKATSVLGPAGRVFYVSPGSVYVWTTENRYYSRTPERSRSVLYKLPLDGSAPSALGVTGSPIDQFSFQESGDGFLNVLVRNGGSGDGMWGAESTDGKASLLRVRIERFSDGSSSALASEYTDVPEPKGYMVQNRFVGDYLLYGSGSGWGYANDSSGGSRLNAVRYETGEVYSLRIPHGVDRIEALGRDAIAIGTDGTNLHFSPVDLAGRPSIGSPYVRENASQGELRSHGFFYKSDSRNSGVLGLPIRESGRPGYEHLFNGSASILFLRNDGLELKELGSLRSGSERTSDDNCKASCVDWYGNARPLFVRGRIIALLGYELVEGRFSRDRLAERRRTSFSPAARLTE